MDFKFLENTKAMIFKTLTYLDQSEADIVNNLKKELKKLPKGSYIRIEIKNDNTLLKNLKEFITAYPDYRIKFKTENEIIKKIDILETVESKAFEININNIKELMMKELVLSSQELLIFNEELDSAIMKG